MLFQEMENSFSNEVELAVEASGSYINSVLLLCEKYNIEPRAAAKLLTRPIIEKIEREGVDSNILPKRATLPV